MGTAEVGSAELGTDDGTGVLKDIRGMPLHELDPEQPMRKLSTPQASALLPNILAVKALNLEQAQSAL